MPGMPDLADPNLWQEAGGLIILSIVLLICLGAIARQYVVREHQADLREQEHDAEIAQLRSEFEACLKGQADQMLGALKLQIAATEQNNQFMRSLQEGLQIAEQLRELTHGHSPSRTTRK